MNIKKIIVSSYEHALSLRSSLSPIQSKGVVSMHRCGTTNVGDIMCAPHLYFNQLTDGRVEDVSGYLSSNIGTMNKWFSTVQNNDIILGGGGLLDRESFTFTIDYLAALASRNKKVVLWGVGHNNRLLEPSSTFYGQIKKFKLVGVRDWNVPNTDWVPCPSCLNSKFDQDYEVTKELGMIVHHHIPISTTQHFGEFSHLQNDSTFSGMIKFIGQHEYIVTNSYHAMYWSMLMNRKVIVIPNSSKMYSFKYKVPCCNDINDLRSYMKKTIIHDGLLDECREANTVFSHKVFDYLGL